MCAVSPFPDRMASFTASLEGCPRVLCAAEPHPETDRQLG
jgi:hypothetical protein